MFEGVERSAGQGNPRHVHTLIQLQKKCKLDRSDEAFLLRFLRGCKYNIEKTANKLAAYQGLYSRISCLISVEWRNKHDMGKNLHAAILRKVHEYWR